MKTVVYGRRDQENGFDHREGEFSFNKKKKLTVKTVLLDSFDNFRKKYEFDPGRIDIIGDINKLGSDIPNNITIKETKFHIVHRDDRNLIYNVD